MMHQRRTWILVADAGRARIFQHARMTGGLMPVEGAYFENAAAAGRIRHPDRLPRVLESVGSARHAIEPRPDPQRQARSKFAKRLAAYLEHCALVEKFEQLILIAPAPMLGDLRTALGKWSVARLAGTSDKDLTKLPPAAIQAHLQSLVLL